MTSFQVFRGCPSCWSQERPEFEFRRIPLLYVALSPHILKSKHPKKNNLKKHIEGRVTNDINVYPKDGMCTWAV